MHELPDRVGEASGSLKILRNCLFSPPQKFLWYLLCFVLLHILRENGINIEHLDGALKRDRNGKE